MKLSQPIYGKARMRVMKVMRDTDRHSLRELEISVMLKGNFDDSYMRGDNSLLIPTDTIRNVINVLAKDKLGGGNEEFGMVVIQHFLAGYAQLDHVHVRLCERSWGRLRVQGRPHPHSFVAGGGARPIVEVRAWRDQLILNSGIEDLLILKTAEAGFGGFPNDPYTTLAETRERILGTKLQAAWTYQNEPPSYSESNAKVLDALIESFASIYSPSAQSTLYQMGEAALNAVPEISEISLTMPAKHYQLVDLAPFGLENQNELFFPIEEPQEDVQGTVTRE